MPQEAQARVVFLRGLGREGLHSWLGSPSWWAWLSPGLESPPPSPVHPSPSFRTSTVPSPKSPAVASRPPGQPCGLSLLALPASISLQADSYIFFKLE